MDKVKSFLTNESTRSLIQDTLLEHRNGTTGNIELASLLIDALMDHYPKVEGVTHYATKIANCSFKIVDGRFVLDHEKIEYLGWFISNSIGGVEDSGFWNTDKLTSQMYSPTYSRCGRIPNPDNKRMPSNQTYKCAVSRPLPVKVDESAAFLIETSPKSGMYVTLDNDVFSFLNKQE